jgi:hypothetical protein
MTETEAPAANSAGNFAHDRVTARVNRLLYWYPRSWRARYGEEFAAMLHSSFEDGKGGFRLSLDVAREGSVARLTGAGFIGTLAPRLDRARASLALVFVGIMGFIAGLAVLTHYIAGWRSYPTVVAIKKAQVEAGNAISAHAHQLHGIHRLRGAKAAAAAAALGRTLNHDYQEAFTHRASGAPLVLDRIGHDLVNAAVTCLGALLIMALVASSAKWKTLDRRRLILPCSLILAAGGLLLLRSFAFHENLIGPVGLWGGLQAMAHGNYWLWRVAVHESLGIAGFLFFTMGGAILLRRAELDQNMCRMAGRVAKAAVAALGVALLLMVAWAITLDAQAPGFLTWHNEGALGASLLPIFLVVIAVMTATCSLIFASSTRCMRALHEGSEAPLHAR